MSGAPSDGAGEGRAVTVPGAVATGASGASVHKTTGRYRPGTVSLHPDLGQPGIVALSLSARYGIASLARIYGFSAGAHSHSV